MRTGMGFQMSEGEARERERDGGKEREGERARERESERERASERERERERLTERERDSETNVHCRGHSRLGCDSNIVQKESARRGVKLNEGEGERETRRGKTRHVGEQTRRPGLSDRERVIEGASRARPRPGTGGA